MRDPYRDISFYPVIEFEEKLKAKLARNNIDTLPLLPTNRIEWIQKHRPLVAGKPRNFDLEPFWIDVYEDNHPDIFVRNGRQTFKTTFSTDIIGCDSTSHANWEIGYVVDTEAHKIAYSKQRLRRETFGQNNDLKIRLDKDRVNVGEILLTDGTIIYILTDENEYNQVESRSLKVLIFDELQYQDVQYIFKALYTLSQTKGRVYKLGIGGEAGSEYHKLWKRTDQRRWVYDDPTWRKKLVFDDFGAIVNHRDELKSILAGRWIADAPENTQYRGYWMPQTIFARIPLTIDSAVKDYKTKPEFSVEYQQKYYPSSIYMAHTMGDFYKAERRPITPEMVEACYDYNLKLLSPEEVRALKDKYQNRIRVIGGVDWGSGPSASSTVPSVWIKWKETGRYQIVHVEKRPKEHQLDQARYIAELFGPYGYNIDIGVGDLGYGAIQVKAIQDGGRDSKDNKFDGVGAGTFMGCRSYGDETKPFQEYQQTEDEHGEEVGRLQIDKTTAVQKFVDFVGWYVSDPEHPNDERYKRTKLIIPMKNSYEADWLLDDFCAITRKDLEKEVDIKDVEDKRQKPKKEFNHPRDSVMSSIYCLTADEQEEGGFDMFGVDHAKVR